MSCVHAEATDRRVDVRGICGKEHFPDRMQNHPKLCA
jgi:hypothetical protein